MYYDEYGMENSEIVVFLHGANFVHTFGRQYPLAGQYHLYVPHIMGFGREAGRLFETEKAAAELAEFTAGLGRQVTLVGFSLGAQLGYKLVCEHQELFRSAVLISPWLLKDGVDMETIIQQNEKQLASMKKRGLCNLIGMMNGLPKVQRKEFVEQMQQVSPKTIRNSVDNGIELDEKFSAVTVPVLALAGEKEQPWVKDSVKRMAARNPNCKCEIWERAAHNIPPMFAKRLNGVLVELLSAEKKL